MNVMNSNNTKAPITNREVDHLVQSMVDCIEVGIGGCDSVEEWKTDFTMDFHRGDRSALQAECLIRNHMDVIVELNKSRAVYLIPTFIDMLITAEYLDQFESYQLVVASLLLHEAEQAGLKNGL